MAYIRWGLPSGIPDSPTNIHTHEHPHPRKITPTAHIQRSHGKHLMRSRLLGLPTNTHNHPWNEVQKMRHDSCVPWLLHICAPRLFHMCMAHIVWSLGLIKSPTNTHTSRASYSTCVTHSAQMKESCHIWLHHIALNHPRTHTPVNPHILHISRSHVTYDYVTLHYTAHEHTHLWILKFYTMSRRRSRIALNRPRTHTPVNPHVLHISRSHVTNDSVTLHYTAHEHTHLWILKFYIMSRRRSRIVLKHPWTHTHLNPHILLLWHTHISLYHPRTHTPLWTTHEHTHTSESSILLLWHNRKCVVSECENSEVCVCGWFREVCVFVGNSMRSVCSWVI